MLYGAFTFNAAGNELSYVYSESLQDMKDYVNRTLPSLKKNQSIGIWEMDEFGMFDMSEDTAEFYKKKLN